MTSKGLPMQWEVILYAAFVALASGLRLGGLGWPPLTESEARQALGAAWKTPGASAHWAPDEEWAPEAPAYNALTRWVFQFGKPSEALARLMPALAGVGLVLAPLWMRPRLGRGPALMTSFVLAVSPTMVTVSRTAGGESLALLGVGVGLALLFGVDNPGPSRVMGAAAATGLALASGSSVFTACLGLGLAYLGLRLLRRTSGLMHSGVTAIGWGWLLVASLGTLLLIATSFGGSLSDAAGVAGSLAGWLRGWSSMGQTSALTALLILVLYEPLTLLYGVVGGAGGRGRGDVLGAGCGAWAVGAVLVTLAYPMREPAALAWAVLPLSVLAGRALASLADRLIAGWTWLGHGTLVPVLLLFLAIAGIQFSNYAAGRGPGIFALDPAISLGLALAVLAVAAVIVVLYASGWSVGTALESAGAAAAVVTLLLSLSMLWRSNLADTAASAGEPWRAEAFGPGVRLLTRTLEGLSQAHTGRIDALPVTTAGPASASMGWQLRSFPRAAEAEPGASPEVVVALEGFVPDGLAAEYLGQTLTVGERRAWQGVLPPQSSRWWLTRQAPTEPVRWLMLVRLDLATLGEEPSSAP